MAPLTVEKRIEDLELEYRALKSAFRLSLYGYGILVLVMVIVAIAIANHNARAAGHQIRHDLNKLASAACKTSTRAFIDKHNALVDEIVFVRTSQANREEVNGDFAAAKADRLAAARYKLKRIHRPTDKECARPILKP